MIQQKRIRNPKKYIQQYNITGDKVHIYCPKDMISQERLSELGLNFIRTGESILAGDVGPISKFNSEGKFKKLKNEPMETIYRHQIRPLKDWGGNIHEKEVDIPYKRYPREFTPPPSIELLASVNSTEKDIFITKGGLLLSKLEDIKHAINLFLELFGIAFFANEDGELVEIKNLRKVNWTILPKGEFSFNDIKTSLEKILQEKSENEQEITLKRLNYIDNCKPNFTAIGNRGFHGYVVFGFLEKNIYILESCFRQNATYVLGENWEKISQLTKNEILSESLHKSRIIHNKAWYKNLETYLK